MLACFGIGRKEKLWSRASGARSELDFCVGRIAHLVACSQVSLKLFICIFLVTVTFQSNNSSPLFYEKTSQNET